jgi:predicted RNA binding protein YcfA (HicA-like mRNA interferase family)
MKLPRDLSGNALAKALNSLDYHVTRQTGSHLRLTATTPTGEHHITIPAHNLSRSALLPPLSPTSQHTTGSQGMSC